MLKYVAKQRVLAAERHVVRHYVLYPAEAVRFANAGKLKEIFRCSKLRVYPPVIRYIVSVRASFAGFKYRRCVYVRDAKLAQVCDDGFCVCKSK